MNRWMTGWMDNWMDGRATDLYSLYSSHVKRNDQIDKSSQIFCLFFSSIAESLCQNLIDVAPFEFDMLSI